jgi:ATP-dependent helicase/nuclease subunit B
MPMSSGVVTHRVEPGAGFVDACARHLLEAAATRDLTGWRVVVPNLMMAPALKRALVRCAGHSLLLPPVETLQVHLAPWAQACRPLPDHRRRFALYAQLRERRWFAQGNLWALCAEFIALFDELTEHGACRPESETALLEQLARAYAARDDEALRFEARVVHALWMAETAGAPSLGAARLLGAVQWSERDPTPLLVISEGRLPAPWRAWLDHHAEHAAVILCEADRSGAGNACLQFLEAAWPSGASQALRDRMLALPVPAALDDRVVMLAADTLEQEANAVVTEVHRARLAGMESIALVAIDRLVARRARALLERDGILVADESGWKLSTTRAAALVDACLEVVVRDGYHRDVLDLVKSPFVFGTFDEAIRNDVILDIERAIGEANHVIGLAAIETLRFEQAETATAVARLRKAQQAMLSPRAPAGVWIDRLQTMLLELDALEALDADAAGQVLLDWLAARAQELQGEHCALDFDEWRAWLDAGLDEALFRDRSIRSPVVMTHLPACRLRHFELAVVIGADDEQLQPDDARPIFAHEGVRQDLGLPGRPSGIQRLRDDLAGLIASCDRVVFTWQHQKDGEPRPLAADLDLLDLAHRLCHRRALVQRAGPVPQPTAVPLGTAIPAPSVPLALRPEAITAYGYEALVNCPYQYFVRFVLGIEAVETVQETMEKRDYGQFVHEVLDRFHQRYPTVSGEDPLAMLDLLTRLSEAAFEAGGPRGFLETAWLRRWCQRLPDYLDWQQAREAEGWRYDAGEHPASCELALSDGGRLRLKGRLDRIDRSGDALAVLDYKTRDLKILKDKAADPEDVQLAVYTALMGEAVSEAGYVALDGKKLALATVDDPADHARAQMLRLRSLFEHMGEGTPLVANGVGPVCSWCDARGVCRKDHHER